MIRMSIIFLTILHGILLINGTVINYVNIGLMFDSDLKKLRNGDRVQNFAEQLHKYRQLQIVMTIINHTVENLVAASMLTMFICFVIMGFTVVRLGNFIPMSIILMCIAFILFFSVFVDTMMPLAVGQSARSEAFVRNLEMQNQSKKEQKELKSCSILRLRVGPYTTLSKEFRTNFLSIVLYHTVNLIIML